MPLQHQAGASSCQHPHPATNSTWAVPRCLSRVQGACNRVLLPVLTIRIDLVDEPAGIKVLRVKHILLALRLGLEDDGLLRSTSRSWWRSIRHASLKQLCLGRELQREAAGSHGVLTAGGLQRGPRQQSAVQSGRVRTERGCSKVLSSNEQGQGINTSPVLEPPKKNEDVRMGDHPLVR
jgi:hypothetical protein